MPDKAKIAETKSKGPVTTDAPVKTAGSKEKPKPTKGGSGVLVTDEPAKTKPKKG